MAGEIAYKLTAEEKQAIDAIRKVAEGFAGVEGGVKKVADETKKLEREQAEMGRLAKRVLEEIQTPLDRYANRMVDLKGLLAAGKISQAEYGEAARQAGQKLDAAGAAAERVGTKGVAAFKGLGREIVSTIGTLAGVSGVLGTVTAVLGKMEEARKEAANRARESEFSYGSLAEISHGSEEEYRRNVAAARKISVEGGLSENQAALLQLTLAKAGVADQYGPFAQAAAGGLIENPVPLAKSAVGVYSVYGKGQTGDLRAILNAAVGAGGGTPGRAEELLKGVADAGPFAKLAGIGPGEAMAAVAATAHGMGGAGEAAAGLKMFAKSLARLQTGETGTGYTQDQYDADEAKLKAQEEAAEKAKRDEDLAVKMQRVREGTKHGPAAREAQSLRILQEDADRAESWRQQEAKFKELRDELAVKKKSVDQGLGTDEDGQVIDADTRRLRGKVSEALTAAKGQGLLAQTRVIAGMNLSPADLQKVLPRGAAAWFGQMMQNQGGYEEAGTAMQAARESDLFGKMAILPGTDPSVAATGHARVQKAGEVESARPLGNLENIYQAAESRYYRMIREGTASTFLPTEAAIGLHKVAVGTIGKLPGQKERSLRAMYDAGGFDVDRLEPDLSRRDPVRYRQETKLKSDVEDALGLKMDTLIQETRRVREAVTTNTQDRRQAAAENRRPTLAAPDQRN